VTTAIAHPILVAVAFVGLSYVVSGAALLVVRRARLAGGLVTLAGAAGMAGAALVGTGHADSAWFAVIACGALLTLAATAYPVLRWQHPVDFVAVATIVGCGVLCLFQWRSDAVVGSLGLTIGVTLFAHTWWRLERSAAHERRALQWMALAVGSSSLVTGFVSFASEAAGPSAFSLALFALIGPALYVGVALPEIVDVRGLVVRAVVLAVSVITYVTLFVTLASFLEIVADRPLKVGALSLVGALVAITFQPLQVMLRGVIDELLFGSRPDPLGAASEVAGRIGDDPLLALRAIREALVLPYAALRVDGTELAASGTATTHTRTLVLDGSSGELVVGLRPGDLRFSSDDEHVLRLTVPLLAQTLRARALAADLQESRGQSISTIEEERRRLRRDLHDGLGPRLSGIAFTSDAARNLIRSDPAGADELLRTLRAETVTAIEDIRRLVYAMRPPALDELGLVPALRQQATELQTVDGGPLVVTVVAPGDLPQLPAAVEVAAYRIVVEALANICRHTRSPTARVCLDVVPEGLRIAVEDEGGASLTAWTPGVGLASMRERAAELGGRLTYGWTNSGGRVQALLPLGGPTR
jgi:signal transduction histidine kinase